MSDLDEREHGFEAKFRLEQEVDFKIEARRARLIGLWAAAKLGLVGEVADSYAAAIRDADIARPKQSEMQNKLLADFGAAGVAITREELAAEMDRAHGRAREQIMGEISVGTQKL